ncbi:MAG: bifunctional pyr operon transcriptional regulator/uracil phosphoribosyltransferase PyrR [Deltaproteobacteria bacterium]|nr:bifunctional pyr operon transcriptional regulator/uracil phosphoribosyltransferase PyrR [Deltaproteobacteria bacterium]MCB9788282.1 bifunctional pyr operon transcriptional regulator/uracil phosphoribosyltransferase PyrR [Deltaproteobacteria bacterium]
MSHAADERLILDADGVRRALRRIAREIVESCGGVDRMAIVGIHTGGVHLARRLAELIAQDEGRRPDEGMLDITLYRDDVLIGLPQPVVGRTEMPFDVTGQRVVLVDDVLFTGRTVRAALDAVIDYGRPAWIRLAVLADRGMRELPIQADFVGLRVSSVAGESVKVELTEEGAPEDRVVLRRPGGAR